MVGPVYSSISRLLNRRLTELSRASADSLQRLSTGQRILRPGDDLASFSVLTKVESQVRGLRQASLNINAAQGIVATADTDLSTLSDIALKLKDLALQAANSSLSSSERSLLNEEASVLLNEFSSISSASSFGDRRLLDGSLEDMYIQTGANAGEGFSFSIGDARATSLGKIAIYSGAQGALTNAIGSSAAYALTLNGVSIGGAVDDGLSSSGGTYSGIAAAAAINRHSDETGVFAEALATERTLYFDDTIGGSFIFEEGDFQINGVSILGAALGSPGQIVSAINDYSSSTGVTASVDSNGEISLVAEDGRNIQITISNSSGNDVFDVFDLTENNSLFGVAASSLSNGADETHTGAIEIYSSKAIVVAGGASVDDAIGMTDGVKGLVTGTSTANVYLGSEEDASRAIKILEATLEDISRLRSEVGSVHSRLDIQSASIFERTIDLESFQENLGGVDLAFEVTNLAILQMMQDSTLAAITQANTSYSAVSRLLSESFNR